MTAPTPVVVVVDGVYHVEFTPGISRPMFQHGAPLQHLGGGWRLHSLYSDLAPVLLIELQHESGERATWFFDCHPRFLGSTVSEVPARERQIVLRKATALLSELLFPITGHRRSDSGNHVERFWDISPSARRQIISACSEALLPSAAIIQADRLPGIMPINPRVLGGRMASISRQHLMAALNEDFQLRLLTALRDGYLSWPSPVDGSDCPSSGSLVLNELDQAYRFEHEPSGLIYFLLVTQHVAQGCGLYFPSERLIVFRDAMSEPVVASRFVHIAAMVVDYLGRLGPSLNPYFRQGRQRVGALLQEHHITHQLWNELSGLEMVLRAVDAHDLPEIFALGGQAGDAFGPLDEIFPELSGTIGPRFQTLDELIRHTQRNHLSLARFNTDFVSKQLRERIVGCVRSTPIGRDVEAARRAAPGPLIIVGLRVENRTIVDLAGFLVGLVATIANVLPGCQIVLDGQNRAEDGPPADSTGDEPAIRSLLDVEREICRQVIASAADQPVTVISTSGQPVTSSIAWASMADCFISLWGTGLAKYRWVCNTPGFVITSNALLLHDDLMIYNAPAFMEAPSPVYFVDPAAVRDDPGAPQLVPMPGSQYANFHVDEAMVFEEIRTLLTPLGG